MKRYVRECITEQIKNYESIPNYGSYKPVVDCCESLKSTLRACERGLITDWEAIKTAVKTVEGIK